MPIFPKNQSSLPQRAYPTTTLHPPTKKAVVIPNIHHNPLGIPNCGEPLQITHVLAAISTNPTENMFGDWRILGSGV
jgi:hypothetical protein